MLIAALFFFIPAHKALSLLLSKIDHSTALTVILHPTQVTKISSMNNVFRWVGQYKNP